jgi:PLD-like domain
MAKACFTEISVRIQTLLESREGDLRVVVAWFTSPFLYRVIENVLKAGRKATIIVSDHPHNFNRLDYPKLIRRGAELLICPEADRRFMHHKFCLVGNTYGFTGSYNWSLQADKNWENIVEFDEPMLIKQFEWMFGEVLKTSYHFNEEGQIPGGKETDAEAEDSELFELQQAFESRVRACMVEALKIAPTINGDRVFGLLDRYGAVGAARLLASAGEGKVIQPGFEKLMRKGRPDLTFERQINLPEFAPLFDEKVIGFAAEKLKRGEIEAQLPVAPKNRN